MLVILLFIGILGYKFISDYTWIDAVYMTVITITTVGFAEVNPEKCIVLAESVDEINSLEKSSIEKQIQDLEGLEDDSKKEQLYIAKAKVDAIESNYYEKI